MAEIVNLRRHRKARERQAAAAEAQANRATFGRTRGERDHEAAEAAERDRLLDGARLDLGGDTQSSLADGPETQ